MLIVNEMGDHQMQRYFSEGGSQGGMLCSSDFPSLKFNGVFEKVEEEERRRRREALQRGRGVSLDRLQLAHLRAGREQIRSDAASHR